MYLYADFVREFSLFFTSKSIPIPCDWNDKTILFGSLHGENVFNLVLLKAKYFIFNKKLRKLVHLSMHLEK